MDKSENELKFEEYRQYLHKEATRLTSYIVLYRGLEELRYERLDEINMAPAFFQVVVDALLSAIVLWVEKIFDEQSQRGLINFLTFCEYHRDLFALKELQRRKNYPDDHWMLKNREPITCQTIINDKKRVSNVQSLPSFKLRRDKFHAHFDKKYFFDREKLENDAPLKRSDLTQLIEVMKDIINKYSADYDGSLYAIEPFNINDIEYLLNCLHSYKNKGR